MRTLCFVALLLTGCATQPAQHGIPNYGESGSMTNASSGGYKHGGEPTEWTWLADSGITEVIQLDPGPSPGAPFHVMRFPISTWQQIFGGAGLRRTMAAALNCADTNWPNAVFIHCAHGKNRTMTLVGMLMRERGFSDSDTRAEMNKYGWGDSFPGLKQAYADFQVTTNLPARRVAEVPPMPISAPAVKRTSAVAAVAVKPRDSYLPLLLPMRTNGYWAIAARKNSGPWYYPPGWHSCPAWYRPEGWVAVTNNRAPGLMQYRAQWHKELWP